MAPIFPKYFELIGQQKVWIVKILPRYMFASLNQFMFEIKMNKLHAFE